MSGSGGPPPSVWLAAAVVLIAASMLGGCATLQTLTPKSAQEVELSPWQLPADTYPSQRLYRVKYDGPEGKVGFKLTLYLEDRQRYRMQAADVLGRKLWSLDVDATDRALVLDHRNEVFCQSSAAGRITLVQLAHLPLVSLPRLLLGQMPAEPVTALEVTAESISFRDAVGQTWNGGLTQGLLMWWTLIEGGEPVAWWRREDKGGIYSDRRQQQQVLWREVVSETLVGGIEAQEIPPSYREGICNAAGSV